MNSDTQQKPPVRVNSCMYCGSANIVRRVKIDQTADAGRIGLSYRARFLLIGTEPIFADLCDDCGSLLRMFVEERGKKWVTE